jgi:hypothetical protein
VATYCEKDVPPFVFPGKINAKPPIQYRLFFGVTEYSRSERQNTTSIKALARLRCRTNSITQQLLEIV